MTYQCFCVSLWLDLFQGHPSPPPPHPAGHLSDIFSLLIPHGGAFAKGGQPGGGALSTRSYLKKKVFHFQIMEG